MRALEKSSSLHSSLIVHSEPKLFDILYPISGKFVSERLFENG